MFIPVQANRIIENCVEMYDKRVLIFFPRQCSIFIFAIMLWSHKHLYVLPVFKGCLRLIQRLNDWKQ